MNKIYFDNAATTFPKPDSVIKAMFDYMSFEGGSANRGSSSTALQSSRAVYECRYEIAKFFNFPKSENVIFKGKFSEFPIIKNAQKFASTNFAREQRHGL